MAFFGDFADASVNVPLNGWDYSEGDFNEFNKYALQGNLTAGNYISATLVWDRIVALDSDWDSDGEFDAADGTNPEDTFATIAFDNLDLHIVPAGTTSLETAVWKASSTAGPDESSVEHIFAAIPTNGQYEIWVESNEVFGAGPYALAWWATTMLNPVLNGDYDDSAIVGQGDLDLVLTNWGDPVPPTPAGWINQVPTDGQVGQNELDVVLTNWGNTGGAGSLAGRAVPEPSGVMLLVVGLASIGWRSGAKPKQAPLERFEHLR